MYPAFVPDLARDCDYVFCALNCVAAHLTRRQTRSACNPLHRS